jgi:hypothetical protein
MACADAARILRPPGTRNHKTTPPRPVECVRVDLVSYQVRDVIGHLPDPTPEIPAPRPVELDDDDPLRRIPAAEYIPALTGREVGRDAKARCPFHGGGEERTPSLHAYGNGFFCFGCERGGSIIDFGALLYGLEPRGASFHDIRRRLAGELLARAAA